MSVSSKTSKSFKVKKITQIKDLQIGEDLPTSDLCITNDDTILQFDFIEPEEDMVPKVTVKPGVFTILKNSVGISLIPTKMETGNALESVDNTARIKKELESFYGKLHIYEELQLPKKRAILLYGEPGTGKTFSIKKAVNDLISQDPGVTVLIWPTSEISSEVVSKFLSFAADYTKDVTKVVLIMEDIGGSEEEVSSRVREVSSGILQLLDGVNVVFRLPTFIIATTNFPQKLLSNLADRPGRFDELIDMPPPPLEQKIALLEFIAKRLLSDEEKNALKMKGADKLSIAHLKEIIVRTRIHDKTINQVVKEMIEHRAKFEAGFEKRQKMGFFDED
jgi:SpoVK/Ycf46/Vps4 family AAA+-type ATPase